MKEKTDDRKRQYPVKWATNEIKAERLKTIRKKLGLSCREMAAEMKMSFHYLESIEESRRNCSMAFLALAEHLLQRKYNADYKEKVKNKKIIEAQKVEVELPQAIAADPKVRLNILRFYAQGMTSEDIAKRLALRPEVVRYYLSNVDE